MYEITIQSHTQIVNNEMYLYQDEKDCSKLPTPIIP
jgi:hypothetical protein